MNKNGITIYIRGYVVDVNKSYYVCRKHKYSKVCDECKLPIGSGIKNKNEITPIV
jgi:hypothetical protein